MKYPTIVCEAVVNSVISQVTAVGGAYQQRTDIEREAPLST